MTDRQTPLTELPVGFETFHRQKFINYQLNRAHALGYADTQRLHEAASEISDFEDCVKVFTRLSVQSEGEAPSCRLVSEAG